MLLAIPALLRALVSQSGLKTLSPVVFIAVAAALLLGVYAVRHPDRLGALLGPAAIARSPRACLLGAVIVAGAGIALGFWQQAPAQQVILYGVAPFALVSPSRRSRYAPSLCRLPAYWSSNASGCSASAMAL